MLLTNKQAAAVLFLVEMNRYGKTNLTYMAEKIGFCVSSMESIAADLKRAGFIKSVKGMYGGYVLACNLKEITVRDIIDYVDTHGQTMRNETRFARIGFDAIDLDVRGKINGMKIADFAIAS